MKGYGGMHRLHELSDKEKLYKRIVNGLYGDYCRVDNVEIKHNAGEVPIMSCELTMPYKNYIDTDDAADGIAYHYVCGRGNGKSRRSFKNYMDFLNSKNLTIEKVHFSGPVTAVIWSDGTKTVVRCDKEDFDHEKGLAMAIAKKFLGTNETGSNYYDVFKKWLPEEKSTPEPISKTKTDVTSEGITIHFDNDEIRKSIDRAFKMPPFAFFGRGE